MAKNVVIGHGMIATALKEKLGDYSWYPTEDTKIIYYMGGPTHMDFEKNENYHSKKTLAEFALLLDSSQKLKARFVYPSSALVYEKETPFAKIKGAMESFAFAADNTVGLRIFPVYGPRENKTVISKWCRQMRNRERPEVFGNGTQERDFIYIDDVIDQIIERSKGEAGIYDVGAGKPIAFNQIIKIINKQLGTHLEPTYLPAPANYSKGIYCKEPLPTKVSIEEGIKRILHV